MKKISTLLVAFALSNCSPTNKTDQYDWQPYPDKVDMLVVVAHPDDEGYWGGLLPYYSICEQKSIVLISLTSGEWGNGFPHPVPDGAEPDCSFDDSYYPCFPAIPKEELVYPNYYREQELNQALELYDMKYKAITPRYKDMNGIGWDDAEKGFEFWGGRDEIVGYLTGQIRRFKPDLVVGLDWHGANGNPQHAAAGRGAYYATEAASDPTLFPDEYDAWQVKKMYSHLRNEDLESSNDFHFHEWEIPCEYDSKINPRKLGAIGNAIHVSQEMKEECDPANGFILRVTTVGEDVINKNNLFENL